MLARSLGILLFCCLAGCGSAPPGDSDDAHPGVTVYNVQRGDTLYSIAFRYGLDYRQVARVNGISDPYIIYPGQNIYLWKVPPSQASRAYTRAPGGTAPATGSKTSPVIVTAVPGIAAAPVSRVTPPPAAGSPSRAGTGQTPVIQTPPINTAAVPAGPTTAPAPAPASAPQRSPTPTPGGRVTDWRWPSAGRVTRSYSSSVHKGIDIGGSRGDPVYAVADGTVVYAGTGIVGFGELLIVKHNAVYLSAYGHNDRLLVRENDIVGAGQKIAEKGSTGTDTVKLHFEIRKEGKPVDPLKLLPRR